MAEAPVAAAPLKKRKVDDAANDKASPDDDIVWSIMIKDLSAKGVESVAKLLDERSLALNKQHMKTAREEKLKEWFSVAEGIIATKNVYKEEKDPEGRQELAQQALREAAEENKDHDYWWQLPFSLQRPCSNADCPVGADQISILGNWVLILRDKFEGNNMICDVCMSAEQSFLKDFVDGEMEDAVDDNWSDFMDEMDKKYGLSDKEADANQD